MRVIYVTKAVDEANPFVATQVRWIRALASNDGIEHVLVLSPNIGRADLPANVTLQRLPSTWPRRALSLAIRALRTRRREVDFVFVAQGGGPYPALLLPLKVATHSPLYQWKAHPAVTRRMRFYARWCDDLVFTATKGSFPVALDKVRVVGHGIDTTQFQPSRAAPDRGLLSIGRISPVKGLEPALRAVARCRDRFGVTPTLDVVGPCVAKDLPHLAHLEALVRELGLSDVVRFSGPLEHSEVPELLHRYRAVLNLSRTALDKAAAEAMAAGVPVISSNDETVGALPDDLREQLAVPDGDVERLAEVFRAVLSWDDDRRTEVGDRLRDVVVADHSLESFFGKILAEVRRHRGTVITGAARP